MHSTNSVIRFVLILTFVVALVLALMHNGLKSVHEKNEALYNKKATLGAVSNHIEGDFSKITDEEVLEIFNTQIEQRVITSQGNEVDEETLKAMGYKEAKAEYLDLAKEQKKPLEERMLPLYIFTKADGSKYYIFYTRGKGLWDEIWGFIALEDDLQTLAGVSFDHKAETPGLGAEIKDNKQFQKQFIGKKIYDEQGNYTSVDVVKGGAKNPWNEVDGISGATITADGVSDMLHKGFKAYMPYIEKLNG